MYLHPAPPFQSQSTEKRQGAGVNECLLRSIAAVSDSGREARSKIRFFSYLQASNISILKDHKHCTEYLLEVSLKKPLTIAWGSEI